MDDQKITQTLSRITDADPRFSREAYEFIGHVVGMTIAKLAESGEKRHVTGLELLENIRELALQEFGPMTSEVFKHWGLRDTMDIGYVVFNMVDNKLLSRSDNDSIEDFRDVFDFQEAFDSPFLPTNSGDSPMKGLDI